MKKKIGIILISITAAFIFMSGGYGLWLKSLTIKGNIQVRPLLIIEPAAEESAEENPNGEEESQAGDNTSKTQKEDLKKKSEEETVERGSVEISPEDEAGVSGENEADAALKDQAALLDAVNENSSSYAGQGDSIGVDPEGIMPLSEDNRNNEVPNHSSSEDREEASPAEDGSSEALAVSKEDKASAGEQTGTTSSMEDDHRESEGGNSGESEIEAQERIDD